MKNKENSGVFASLFKQEAPIEDKSKSIDMEAIADNIAEGVLNIINSKKNDEKVEIKKEEGNVFTSLFKGIE
ncbi:hypothetical protein [Paenibacillus sp. W2I17]|uniref:hypothetical protein n=1 Tax=Paenibacillus sp. W2I17 TaxID=3042311 RepID=UPI00278898A2|nr:hypothetical protein [Paenibacillus sp. W2I17]MDQ0660602.1 non-homologous end joining protein Ku [Paenibacillus sp. W2I17]